MIVKKCIKIGQKSHVWRRWVGAEWANKVPFGRYGVKYNLKARLSACWFGSSRWKQEESLGGEWSHLWSDRKSGDQANKHNKKNQIICIHSKPLTPALTTSACSTILCNTCWTTSQFQQWFPPPTNYFKLLSTRIKWVCSPVGNLTLNMRKVAARYYVARERASYYNSISNLTTTI